MGIIYIAENVKKPLSIVNGQQRYKAYLGFARTTVEKRFNYTWCGHYMRAFDENCNTKFYCALRKYGKDAFKIRELEVLDTNDLKVLKEREVHWITQYDTYHNGYNMTPGGDGNFSLTKEACEKIRKGIRNYWDSISEEEYKRRCDLMREAFQKPENKAKRHEVNKRTWETHRDIMMKSRQSKAYRELMSKISTEVRQRPEYKEKMREIMSTEEYKEKQRYHHKGSVFLYKNGSQIKVRKDLVDSYRKEGWLPYGEYLGNGGTLYWVNDGKPIEGTGIRLWVNNGEKQIRTRYYKQYIEKGWKYGTL